MLWIGDCDFGTCSSSVSGANLLHSMAQSGRHLRVHPPNLLFLLAALFLLFMQLYLSTVITKLTNENKDIAQQLALLRYDVDVLRTEQMDGQRENAN